MTIVYPSGRWQYLPLNRIYSHDRSALFNGRIVRHLAIHAAQERADIICLLESGPKVALPCLAGEVAMIPRESWHTLLLWLRHRGELARYPDTGSLIQLATVASPEFADRIGRFITHRIAYTHSPDHGGPMRTSGYHRGESFMRDLELAASHSRSAEIAFLAACREAEILKRTTPSR